MKRILSLLLSLVLLCGCGENGTTAAAGKSSELCPIAEGERRYTKVLTESALGIDGESYIRACAGTQQIALFGLRPTGETNGDLQIASDCITLIDRESLEQTCFPFDAQTDLGADSDIVSMAFLDETELLLLCSSWETEADLFTLYVFAPDSGAFSRLTALETLGTQENAVCDMVCLSGQVYISFDNGSILRCDLDTGTETIFSCALSSPEFVCSPQGTLYVVGDNSEIVVEVRQLSEQGDAAQSGLPLIESTWYQVADGYGVYDFFITYENQICGVNIEKREMTIVFDGYDSGIDLNQVRFFAVDDALLLCDNVSDDPLVDDYALYTMAAVNADTDERTVLTLATLSTSSELQDAIVTFNRENTDYMIELTDYSQYGEAGATRLYADFMSGNIPDILNLSGLQETSINSGEYLIDLLPYLRGSYGEELSGLQTGVLQALMSEDELLTLAPNYSLKALCSMTSLGDTLPMDSFCSRLEESADKTMTSRDAVMDILLENTLPELLDTGAGTLDGAALRTLLQTASLYPESAEADETTAAEGLLSGRVSFVSAELSNLRSFRWLLYELGDEISLYGYPGLTDDAVVMEADDYLSITVACAAPDAAWSFLSTLLTLEFQSKYSYKSFPLLKEALEEELAEARASEAGFSENSEALLDGLLSDVSVGSTEYSEALEIIKEEAEPYFSGDKGLEETVKIIQERVQIYSAERQ